MATIQFSAAIFCFTLNASVDDVIIFLKVVSSLSMLRQTIALKCLKYDQSSVFTHPGIHFFGISFAVKRVFPKGLGPKLTQT